jgi:hypothetical protein
MSEAASDIIARLRKQGVSFEIDPIQFRNLAHGQSRDTFLVGHVRGRFTTLIEAMHEARKFCEVILNTDTPPKKLLDKTLFVDEDNDLSGYGWCLAISDHDTAGMGAHRLFTMPPLRNTGTKSGKSA